MKSSLSIRALAVSAGLAWCSSSLLAIPSDDFEELSECLKRLPVHVTPSQVGAEGEVSTMDVTLFHFGDGIADDLTYKMEILFDKGKWMYSVLRITHQDGERLETAGTALFDGISSYFKNHLGPTNQYTITSEIREDGEGNSTNQCVLWRNDLTAFEIDLDYQGKNTVTLNLCVMSSDYHSETGFLGKKIREFYHTKVFPEAGQLPSQFPAKWEDDEAKAATDTKQELRISQAEDPEAVIQSNHSTSPKSGKATFPSYEVKFWVVVCVLIALLSGVIVRRCWKRN
jgi:hypothetical protein